MIFLHGLLGSAANWRRISSAFEADFQILALDQRGHGRSFKPPHGYAPEDFAGDVKFLMDHLSIERAILVGHSMGGRNAICFASLFPERIDKLVIEDIGPVAVPEAGARILEMLRGVSVPFSEKIQAKEYFLGEFGDPKVGGFLYTDIVEDSSGRWNWTFDLKNIEEIVEKGLEQTRWREFENIKCPTLVIRGEYSDELSRIEFEKMTARQPRARGVEIKGTGHWVHIEKPVEFIRELKNFVS